MLNYSFKWIRGHIELDADEQLENVLHISWEIEIAFIEFIFLKMKIINHAICRGILHRVIPTTLALIESWVKNRLDCAGFKPSQLSYKSIIFMPLWHTSSKLGLYEIVWDEWTYVKVQVAL